MNRRNLQLRSVSIFVISAVVCFGMSPSFPCLGQIPIRAMQKKHESYLVTWGDGNVQLVTGETLVGDVQFDPFDQRLGFKRKQSKVIERTLFPSLVSSFEFYDSAIDVRRKYFALSTDETTSDWYEILIELSDFAVVAKETTIRNDRSYLGQNGMTYFIRKGETTETIYFLDGQGGPKPYVSKTFRYNPSITERTWVTRVHDENIIAFYTNHLFEDLKTYAKENKLSFREKWDLVKIMKHYQSLL